MSYDISASGLSGRIVASKTFPSGFDITEWADDTDPMDIPAITLAEVGMNVNGDLVVRSHPQPVVITIAVIPNSNADKNLQVLAEANRAGRGRRPAGDSVSLTMTYADGSAKRLLDGKMTESLLAGGVASGAGLKTSTYTFAFTDIKSDV